MKSCRPPQQGVTVTVLPATSARPSSEDRIKAALWFADQGFRVFSVWSAVNGVCRCPKGKDCDNAGKHPITPNGFHDATTDPGRIRTMLSAGSEPNYGLVCPEGVFALDVDGPDLDELVKLEQRLGPLPPTLRTVTRNGQHIFLRWPEGHPQPLHKLFGFVTRWGSGRMSGYVIGPRSVHSTGVPYSPEGPFEIAEIPANWVEAAVGPSDTIVVRGPRPLPEVGHRHDWLRDRARHYWGLHGDRAAVEALIRVDNAKLAEPKSEEDIQRAIGEVERFPIDPPEQLEERVSRRLNDDEIGLLDLPSSTAFPDPPDDVAFGGVMGELVDELAGGTDASLVGLLGSLYAFCGVLVPSYAYFHRTHTSSPFIALVGDSGVGRKGTAMTRVLDAMTEALDVATVNRVLLDGVNSGEGLVSYLYAKHAHYPHEPTAGLLYEEELASLLASRDRDGSTLDQKMRQAFDGGPISNRRSNETKTVPAPYWLPALMGITPDELRARVKSEALRSGSANRWIHLPVIRRDVDPQPILPRFTAEHKQWVIDRHRIAQKQPVQLAVDDEVGRTLGDYAEHLATKTQGLAGDLTRRMQVLAFRLALVQATMDGSPTVSLVHVDRALALTEYARRGIAWVFGDTIGNPDADMIYRQLQETGRLTKTQITRELVRDMRRQLAAIDELLRLRLVRRVKLPTSGRYRTELVLADEKGSFFPYFPRSNNRIPISAETVERMEESAYDVGKKVEESRKEDGKKWKEAKVFQAAVAAVIDASSNVATRPDGTVWCHFYREHMSKHFSVSSVPRCEICTPEGAA